MEENFLGQPARHKTNARARSLAPPTVQRYGDNDVSGHEYVVYAWTISYSHLLKEGEFAQIIRSAGQMMLDGGVDCCSNH